MSLSPGSVITVADIANEFDKHWLSPPVGFKGLISDSVLENTLGFDAFPKGSRLLVSSISTALNNKVSSFDSAKTLPGGDGSDGDLTMNGWFIPEKDRVYQFNNLTLNVGILPINNGWLTSGSSGKIIILVKETLTLGPGCVIHVSGNPGNIGARGGDGADGQFSQQGTYTHQTVRSQSSGGYYGYYGETTTNITTASVGGLAGAGGAGGSGGGGAGQNGGAGGNGARPKIDSNDPGVDGNPGQQPFGNTAGSLAAGGDGQPGPRYPNTSNFALISSLQMGSNLRSNQGTPGMGGAGGHGYAGTSGGHTPSTSGFYSTVQTEQGDWVQVYNDDDWGTPGGGGSGGSGGGGGGEGGIGGNYGGIIYIEAKNINSGGAYIIANGGSGGRGGDGGWGGQSNQSYQQGLPFQWVEGGGSGTPGGQGGGGNGGLVVVKYKNLNGTLQTEVNGGSPNGLPGHAIFIKR